MVVGAAIVRGVDGDYRLGDVLRCRGLCAEKVYESVGRVVGRVCDGGE